MCLCWLGGREGAKLVIFSIRDYTIESAAIAEEVVSSAARVLMLSGFTEAQVADIFQQAAQKIFTGDAVEGMQSDANRNYPEDECDNIGVWQIADRFEELKPVKALSRLGKRASAIDHIEDGATLTKTIALISEATVLRKEALSWLKDESKKAGLEVAAERDKWTETATDERLDEEHNVVFLDDLRWSGKFSWHIASQVALALAEAGNREALDSFSQIILDEDLAIENRVREDIERAVGAAGQYDKFLAHVRSHAGTGELAQSEFLDRFVRESGFSSGTYTLESWLEGMAKRGELERYKRSNRWRIIVT